MRHTINLFLILAAFWLLNSGHYSVLILSLGLVSVAFVVFISYHMDKVDHQRQLTNFTFRMFKYCIWLLKEIVLANLTVVKHVWLGNDSISPMLTTVKSSQETDIGKVIYANSITMTPGTVTVDFVGDRIMVHSLLEKNIHALETGEMDRRVSQLED